MINIDTTIDETVAELGGVKPNGGSGNGTADRSEFDTDLDKWIEANGDNSRRSGAVRRLASAVEWRTPTSILIAALQQSS